MKANKKGTDGVQPSGKATVFGNEMICQTNLKMSKKLNKISEFIYTFYSIDIFYTIDVTLP